MIRTVVCIVAAWTLLAARPTAQSSELPPQDAFLREARAALARSQALWHRYAYTERRTELHMNPFGRMGTGGTRLTEVRPSPNPQLTYRRVIERNGIAVSKYEVDRQDADYRGRVRRFERAAAGADGAERREHDELLARRRAQMMLDDVVDTLQFRVERREYRNGRPAIVVTFAARPGARPVTREGRAARVFEGVLWIDEASRELTDVRAVAKHDVSFGGFIAKIYQGTTAVVERHEIEPGVWMPTLLTLSGDVRALFRRTKIDHRVEWFDYRAQD